MCSVTDSEAVSETEEELYVFVDFQDNIDIEKYRSIHVLGVTEANPIIQMDDNFFSGKYVSSVGTYMFFEEDQCPNDPDPIFYKLPPKNVKFVCKTNKLITMESAYVSYKNGSELQNKPPESESENIKSIEFSNLQEALNTFEMKWSV